MADQGLSVQCDACDAALTEPGGLAFSPPDDTSDIGHAVFKYHLCRPCWAKVERVILHAEVAP